jgi:hypothetical protein
MTQKNASAGAIFECLNQLPELTRTCSRSRIRSCRTRLN